MGNSKVWVVAGLAVVAAAALIAVSLKGAGDGTAPVAKRDASIGAVRNAHGRADAKVVLVEYGDYLCGFCGQAFKVVEPQLAALIEQGDVRFEYRHRIVTGLDALRAAEASECAADQGYFWAYHSVLMSNQRGQGSFTYDKLKGFARELGLDTKSFNQCVDDRKHKITVEQQNNAAAQLGVTGTPTFLLNGKHVPVQRDFQEVVTAVREAVKNP